jgi:uncharacterized protein (UPF0333 family)
MHILTKKRALGALVTLVVLAVAGVAIAYFTSTGTGEGTVKVSSANATNIAVTSSTSPEDLVPLTQAEGEALAANTTIEVKNPPGNGVVYVKNVEETSITTSKAGCEGTEFVFEGVSKGNTVVVNQEVNPGGKASAETKAKLWLKNAAKDQTACKGATITVHYESK